jgi:hypothetical protein
MICQMLEEWKGLGFYVGKKDKARYKNFCKHKITMLLTC